MKNDLEIEFDAVKNERKYVGVNVMETVLVRPIAEENGKNTVVQRTILRIVFRRIWPVTWCHVRFCNGKIKASGTARAIGFKGGYYGTALLKALGRAGFDITTNGEKTKPWRINDKWIDGFCKTIGFMFRKKDEFVMCKKMHV